RALLQIDPHRAAGYGGVAVVYASSGRVADLDALLSEAEHAVPDNLTAFYEAGRVLLGRGVELPRAERYLRKYLTQDPEGGAPTPRASRLLALRTRAGGRRKARRRYRGARRADPPQAGPRGGQKGSASPAMTESR